MRRRKARQRDALGLVLIFVAIGVLGVLAFVGVLLRPPPMDVETLCRTDRPISAHTIVLVDGSDRLEPRHRRRLGAVIDQERARLAPEQRLSIFALRADLAQEPRLLFSMCLPRDGSQSNPLFENPARAQARWDESVGAALRGAIGRAASGRTARASPILASLRAVVAEPGFETGPRRLVLVSDLLEYAPDGFSLYEENASFAVWRAGTAQGPPDLSGVDVRVAMLDRPEHAEAQAAARSHFWPAFFEAAGARSVRFDPAP